MNKPELHKKLVAGDTDAFEGFFKLIHPRLLSYCRLFVTDYSAADDLVQECFLKLWQKRETLKPTQSVESYLFVMLRNRCFNYLRDKKLEYAVDDVLSVPEIDLQHLFELDFTGVEGRSIEEELIDAIKEEIDKLPEKRKFVFVKSKIEGMKNTEIAELLGVTNKAVEKHLYEAKMQIKRALLQKYPLLAILISFILK
ncbi:RNA polymerase sigma-70 factor [Gaoshiqia sediminis]|uniref:RNA polymerase sigma-70 factor n=1 Tax=Gaoshiqia sediminis TaxID=2986998 RepID=A0AA41Y5N2_9BACT|nr:RNA polymerase sigma-70 factor [Gaoshiqia sediminis]MCW0482379.1 RNA polymerase sigma-70 factor [Gaoshiqia sediminis]